APNRVLLPCLSLYGAPEADVGCDSAVFGRGSGSDLRLGFGGSARNLRGLAVGLGQSGRDPALGLHGARDFGHLEVKAVADLAPTEPVPAHLEELVQRDRV